MASFKALAGVEVLATKKKKLVKPVQPQSVTVQQPEVVIGEPVIVRTPRVVPAKKLSAVERVKSAEESGAMVGTGKLGVAIETQKRRQEVMDWMLNGHWYGGKSKSIPQLAAALGVSPRLIESDIAFLKRKMADWHIDEDQKDIPALAYMLMEMKFQDRGRALALYNHIIEDIADADEDSKSDKPKSKYPLTGRDRAAMYNAALQAMDLANKACNGMDALFKMTGGAQKLQQIFKARQLVINQGGNVVVSSQALQNFAAKELSGLLPSTRKVTPDLSLPKGLELEADEIEVLKLGEGK